MFDHKRASLPFVHYSKARLRVWNRTQKLRSYFQPSTSRVRNKTQKPNPISNQENSEVKFQGTSKPNHRVLNQIPILHHENILFRIVGLSNQEHDTLTEESEGTSDLWSVPSVLGLIFWGFTFCVDGFLRIEGKVGRSTWTFGSAFSLLDLDFLRTRFILKEDEQRRR